MSPFAMKVNLMIVRPDALDLRERRRSVGFIRQPLLSQPSVSSTFNHILDEEPNASTKTASRFSSHDVLQVRKNSIEMLLFDLLILIVNAYV